MIGSIPTETDAEKLRVERLKQMTPEKIAPLAVYLCSDKADGISGQIIGVRNNEIFLLLADRARSACCIAPTAGRSRSSTRSSRTPSSSRLRRSSAPATCSIGIRSREHCIVDLGLAGRHCFVTGASAGIGRGTAFALAAEGAAPVDRRS